MTLPELVRQGQGPGLMGGGGDKRDIGRVRYPDIPLGPGVTPGGTFLRKMPGIPKVGPRTPRKPLFIRVRQIIGELSPQNEEVLSVIQQAQAQAAAEAEQQLVRSSPVWCI